MTQLYRITPNNEGSIKSVLKLKESFARPGMMIGSERRMSVITVYTSGYAYRSIDNPVYLEDLDTPIVCRLDTGTPTLTNANSVQEFEFGQGLDGTHADDLRDLFKDKWNNGIDGIKGLELFTSDKMGSPSWVVEDTEIRVSSPITIDKVEGDQYTNVVESNIQPVSKYIQEEVLQAPRFGLNFKLRPD
jgi:hypothetical protein